MTEPRSLYKKNIIHYTQAAKHRQKQLLRSSVLRLAVFIAMGVGIYVFWGDYRPVIAVTLVGLIIFFMLVSRHTSLRHKRDHLKALIDINQTEIKVLDRQFSDLPNGETYKNSAHVFSQDIDLFGEQSFFQYLNRTKLAEGETKLAQLLTANDTKNIVEKQRAIAELSYKTEFRQEFSALSELSIDQKVKENTVRKTLEYLQTHHFFTPSFAKILSTISSIVSIGFIFAYFTSFISGKQLLLYVLLGLVITGFYIKKVNHLSSKVSQMQRVFRQYRHLLKLIEDTDFSATFLKQMQERISTPHKKASIILHEFSKAIDALDQRHNLLFGFLGNGLLLWDLRQASRLEKWMKSYADIVKDWFEAIAEMEAYNSLGNFAFNHPTYTFPTITHNGMIIKAKDAVHPLIPPEQAVTNDFKIDREEFFIITGANMAGKSTFLRTVALQIVMGNVGLPVCASQCEYRPIKLITSMRTVDSLAEEASYFYAELSRLKFIIDQLKTGAYFIVLDEILKGTNSKDKAIGSQRFLEKLVRSHSTGIIATHDLSLCEVANTMPEVKNHYFDAQIIDDELYFDYKFKPGICQNMNASFLLRKMEIIDS